MPAAQRKWIYGGLTLDVDRHYIGSVTTGKSIITLESNPSRGTVLPAPHGKGRSQSLWGISMIIQECLWDHCSDRRPSSKVSSTSLYDNMTSSISISQIFPSWVAIFHLRPSIAFFCRRLYDMPGPAPRINVLLLGRRDLRMSFLNRDT